MHNRWPVLDITPGVFSHAFLELVIVLFVAQPIYAARPEGTPSPTAPVRRIHLKPELGSTFVPRSPGAMTPLVMPGLVPLDSSGKTDFYVRELRRKQLLLPIAGADVSLLEGHFYQGRAGHMHHAVDILAPRNTPILAIENGKIVKLFTSKAGGTTIYQFDPQELYVYYYAHLQEYAPGLAEGEYVRKGQVIGYVGASGNAPPNTPHLHFSINRLDPDKKWWTGTPIDPYEVFR